MLYLKSMILEKILETHLIQNNIDYSDEQKKQLLIYINELILWNKSHNFIKYNSVEHLIERHIIDSLLAYPYFQKKASHIKTIADIGSGPGIPGIILAIFFPSIEFSLVEIQKKRTNFLKVVKSLMNLNNITIFSQDVLKLEQKFDIITMRAFAPLNKINDLCSHLLHKDSVMCIYVGKKEKILEEIHLIEKQFSHQFFSLDHNIKQRYILELKMENNNVR